MKGQRQRQAQRAGDLSQQEIIGVEERAGVRLAGEGEPEEPLALRAERHLRQIGLAVQRVGEQAAEGAAGRRAGPGDQIGDGR